MKKYQFLSGFEQTCYQFDRILINQIKQAFISSTIASEPIESSRLDRKDYLFIKFTSPIIAFITHEEQKNEKSVVSYMYYGDIELTRKCNIALKLIGVKTELGFRWQGFFEEKKYVEISGFSLKIIYPDNKFILRARILNLIFSEIEKTSFITNHIEYSHYLQSMLSPRTEREHFSLAARSSFFTPSRSSVIAPHQIEAVRRFIAEHIPPVSALYVRANELNINPTYQSADQITRTLESNQKKIWLLRSDFILAVGNKNSNWTNFKDTELSDALERESHQFVNWEDRYGHPSLATPHLGYDGSALYGGYLAQRSGYIEIYTFSGRFHRHDLDDHHKAIMEAYVAYHFQRAYGEQPVVFIDAVAFGPGVLDNFELSFFIANRALPEYCLRRTYDSEKIEAIINHEIEKTAECLA